MRSDALSLRTKLPSSRLGMSIAVSADNRIADIEVTDDTITARLVDGRVISVPLAWPWRRSEASAEQRENWELLGDGHVVHWPDVDEHISAEGMLNGVPARRPKSGPGSKAQSFNKAPRARSRSRQHKAQKRPHAA